MKLKIVAITTAGLSAEILTAIVLWHFTKMQIHDVVAWGLIMYFIAALAVIWLLDRWELNVKVRIRRINRPQIYNLKDYPEWTRKEKSAWQM